MTCQADVTAAIVKDFLERLPNCASAKTDAQGPVFTRFAPTPTE
jgi:hypothetical protein